MSIHPKHKKYYKIMNDFVDFNISVELIYKFYCNNF